MESVEKLYRKAFWSWAIGVAMFFDFTVLPIAWVAFGFNFKFSAIAAACFTLILAPLIAWRMIERIAGDSEAQGYYRIWELKDLARTGKLLIFWGNPIGWFLLILYWCALKAVIRWPSLGLVIAVLFP